MDYISTQKPENYSYYAYSPAIFDYPFDYLFSYYSSRNFIEKPKKVMDQFYLIIRESDSKNYLTSGWYGDKTKDKTQILSSKKFTPNILVEKHKTI